MAFREEIETIIKDKKPGLNQSSVNVYLPTLFNFKNTLHPDGEEKNGLMNLK